MLDTQLGIYEESFGKLELSKEPSEALQQCRRGMERLCIDLQSQIQFIGSEPWIFRIKNAQIHRAKLEQTLSLGKESFQTSLMLANRVKHHETILAWA